MDGRRKQPASRSVWTPARVATASKGGGGSGVGTGRVTVRVAARSVMVSRSVGDLAPGQTLSNQERHFLLALRERARWSSLRQSCRCRLVGSVR